MVKEAVCALPAQLHTRSAVPSNGLFSCHYSFQYVLASSAGSCIPSGVCGCHNVDAKYMLNNTPDKSP